VSRAPPLARVRSRASDAESLPKVKPVSPSWRRRRLLALAATAAAGLGGCGGDDEDGGEVLIKAAAPPLGDRALGSSPPGSGSYNRVAITPKGRPVAAYAIRLQDLSPGMVVGGRSSITVTKCHHTDYEPTNRAATGCQDTRRYLFNPVEVTTQLTLVPDRNGRPDLSDSGVALEDPKTTRCTDLEHHCVPVNFASKELGSGDLGAGEDRWLILKLEARSPKAVPCGARTAPRQCNVLAVETQKHTAMYGVAATGSFSSLANDVPADQTANVARLPTVDDNAARDPARRVVYSVELAEKADVDRLLGDQLIVHGRVSVAESQPLAPLVSGYLVFTDSPERIDGRYLSSDTYDQARRGDTGENCSGRCTYLKPAAATRIARCDVNADRRFVNLVVDSVRDVARPGASIKVLDGGSLEVLDFPSTADTRRSC
jgi:hypothetical protein